MTAEEVEQRAVEELRLLPIERMARFGHDLEFRARNPGGIHAQHWRRGAQVCIADIDDDAAREAARDTGGGAFAAHLDVTRIDSINRLVDAVEARTGGIDILVNNAAIFDMAPIEEITEKSYDRVFAVNCRGTFLMTQAAARAMIPAGKGGRIVNFSSGVSSKGSPGASAYAASRAATEAFSRVAAIELAPAGRRVS